MGGWIASAGSCSIGFNPVPSVGIGNIFAKGFDVKSINRRKPKIIISWKNKVIRDKALQYTVGLKTDWRKNSEY